MLSTKFENEGLVLMASRICLPAASVALVSCVTFFAVIAPDYRTSFWKRQSLCSWYRLTWQYCDGPGLVASSCAQDGSSARQNWDTCKNIWGVTSRNGCSKGYRSGVVSHPSGSPQPGAREYCQSLIAQTPALMSTPLQVRALKLALVKIAP